MRGFEHVLVGVCGGHGEFNAAHADAYDRGDLRQALANAPTGGSGEACPGEGAMRRRAQSSTQAMEANHSRNGLARMLLVEVRSANRSSRHSLMRFSISPRLR